MTCRSTLLFGLIAAVWFVPSAGHAAAANAQQAVWRSGNGGAPQITLQPGVRMVQYTITSDDWQKSRTKVSAELHFTKPKIPSSSQLTTPPTAGPANPPPVIQHGDIKLQPTQSTPHKRIVEASSPPAETPSRPEPRLAVRPHVTIISDEANDRERAYAAVARLNELIEQPDPAAATYTNHEQPVAEAATNTYCEQPFETQPVDDPPTGAIRSTVEQLRLIARKLTGRARPPESRD
ncbi:MAG TPA: hypothetical protein VJ828_02120 [Lacipirellulaceae bacterium]|nr:hypothetical protein [Lacipirellulaceae bacterium]